jgi:hypothetical protein
MSSWGKIYPASGLGLALQAGEKTEIGQLVSFLKVSTQFKTGQGLYPHVRPFIGGFLSWGTQIEFLQSPFYKIKGLLWRIRILEQV